LDILKERRNSKLVLVTSLQQEIQDLPSYIEILVVSETDSGHLCLSSLSKLLYQKGYVSVLVEAGYNLFRQMRTLNLIDECLMIVADEIFKQDTSNLYFPDVSELTQKNQFEGFLLSQKKRLGNDTLFQLYKEAK
jgi:riboflavin biosynthesis pyrimidine reductase